MSFTFCLLGLTLAATQSAAPVPPSAASATVRAADLRADAALLRRALEQLHPGLHRYLDAAGVAAAFDALDAEFTRDRSLAEAYLAFSRLTATLRCGHTYPSFFNQADDVEQALFRGPRVPFYFRWLAGHMIVTRSFAGDARLAPGVEVTAIDGAPVTLIRERLLELARGDGHNDGPRLATLEVSGRARYEAFDVYFPLLFPSAATGFELAVRAPGAAGDVRLRVKAQSDAEREAVRQAAGTSEDAARPLWSLTWPTPRTALLRMPNWATYRSRFDWRADLRRQFDELHERSAEALIIDLRGNEGGTEEVGDVLVSHLARGPVQRDAWRRRVRYRQVPPDLAPHCDTWDAGFKDWGAAARNPRDGFFDLVREGDESPPPAPIEGARFAGQTFVIVGPENSSATFQFAQVLAANRLATLVGRATGGNQRGINGGALFFLRLPRSRLEIDLPLIGYFPEGERPDAGIEPDVRVEPDAADVAAGRDVELEAILARLRARGSAAR